jgi:hypothetical protein
MRTGEREPDYEADIWADHDEACHGRISDLENDHPEGFTWTCCEKLGDDEEGCRQGMHSEEYQSGDEVDEDEEEEEEEEDDDLSNSEDSGY